MAEKQTVATFITQSTEFYERCHEFYQPLNPDRKEIRLMQILPGSYAEDTIQLTLSHVDLADDPYYETISYTWGPMSPTNQVFIHGVAYNVTVNQYNALRRLRSDESRTIWMDVICIDQANLAERGHQVSIMGEIYASAARTDIWLGELDKTWYSPISDEEWMEFMTKLENYKDREKFSEIAISPKRDELMAKFPGDLVEGAIFALEQLATDIHFTNLPYCTISGDNVEFNRSWYDATGFMCAILQRPWWNRVWVLQEALLCKDNPMVLFGGHQMLLDTILKACEAFFKHFVIVECCYSAIPDIFFHIEALFGGIQPLMWFSKIKHEETPGRMDIPTATALATTRKATDTRDFVYGLLGLVRPEDRVSVDYTLSTDEVFARTSWHHFRTCNKLDWLEKGGLRSPSWSVDWTNTDQLGFRMNWTYTMDDTEKPDWSCTRVTGNRLELPASLISKIKLVFEKERDLDIPMGRADFEIISYWFDCLKKAGFESVMLHDPLSLDLDEFSIELFRTFFRDTRVDLKSAEWRRLNEQDLCDIFFWWGGLIQSVKSGSENLIEHEKFWRIATNFRNWTQNSALALTDEHKICMVPAGTGTDDCLYHVRACSPIIVLRPVTHNEFRVIGPGYLHGSMGSEGWKPDEEKVITLI